MRRGFKPKAALNRHAAFWPDREGEKRSSQKPRPGEDFEAAGFRKFALNFLTGR
jgi:hypothetical protein